MAMQNHQMIGNLKAFEYSAASRTPGGKLLMKIGATENHHHRCHWVEPFPVLDRPVTMACMKSDQQIAGRRFAGMRTSQSVHGNPLIQLA